MIDTFEKLMEKMRETDETGIFAILRDRLNEYKKSNYRSNTNYAEIRGFLWAFLATGFIDEMEHEILADKLINGKID